MAKYHEQDLNLPEPEWIAKTKSKPIKELFRLLHDKQLEKDHPIHPEAKWLTKDKQEIPIKDLDDHHLLSIIKMLVDESPEGTQFRTTPKRRTQWLLVMLEEAEKRGLSI